MSYRDIDFRPDSSGLRALYVYEDGSHESLPVVGWLVQETWNDVGDNDKPADRWRRIVAAIMSPDMPMPEAADELDELDDFKAFVRVLHPSESEPDADALAKIHADLIKRRDDQNAWLRAQAEADAPKVLAAVAGYALGVRVGSSLAGLSIGRTSAALEVLYGEGRVTYDKEAHRWYPVNQS